MAREESKRSPGRAGRRAARRRISGERKALYYVGIALIVVGALVFVSNFFLGPTLLGAGGPEPGDPDFQDRAREQHEEFGRGMQAVVVRGLVGMGLMILGAVLMRVGVRGAAGSGLVLDPKQAREDLEPWARMGGGIVRDALDEADLAGTLREAGDSDDAEVHVKVRCPACGHLNDETAKFCSQCGNAL